jgi:hypothetical protein
LGGIFLFAGITKLPHIETLIWEIEQYQILPEFLVSAFGYTLPILEITLGTLYHAWYAFSIWNNSQSQYRG